MNITVILYWENEVDSDYNTFMDSWFHMESFSYDEKDHYFPRITHVLEAYQDTYHDKLRYTSTDFYRNVYPSELHVLVNGVNYLDLNQNTNEYTLAKNIHEELVEVLTNYVDARNEQVQLLIEKIESDKENTNKEKEIAMLKTLFEKYGPDAIDK